jgi:hypothetical protein
METPHRGIQADPFGVDDIYTPQRGEFDGGTSQVLYFEISPPASCGGASPATPSLNSTNGCEKRLLNDRTVTLHASLSHRVGISIFNLKIYIVDLFAPPAKTIVEGLKDLNVCKILRCRMRIVSR